jgi:hypothetical protein
LTVDDDARSSSSAASLGEASSAIAGFHQLARSQAWPIAPAGLQTSAMLPLTESKGVRLLINGQGCDATEVMMLVAMADYWEDAALRIAAFAVGQNSDRRTR